MLLCGNVLKSKTVNLKMKGRIHMAQLWGGRFTKETDQLVYNFNASITFDKDSISRTSEEVLHM